MKIKLLQIATTYQSLVTILDTKLGLLAQNPDIELHVASAFEDPDEKRVTHGKYHEVPMERTISPVRDAVSVFRLYKYIKQNRFDIIHTHTAKAGIIGALAGRLAKVPVVHTYHGLPFYKGQNIWEYAVIKNAEKALSFLRVILFSQNKFDVDVLHKSKWSSNKILFEGNGVSPDVVLTNAINDRGKVQDLFSGSAFHILCISRIEIVKMPEKVLDIVLSLRKKNIPVECIIAGKGYLQKPLEHKIKEYGLTDCVKIIYTQYIHALIAKADIVVLTSKKEGVPRSLLEAMTLKKPIVATDVQGTRELVIDQENGILVGYNDQAALDKAAYLLYTDATLRKKYGEAGYSRVLQNFVNEKQTVDLWKSSYNKIVNPHNCDDKSKRVLFVSTVGYTTEAFLIPYISLFIDKGYKVVACANWNYCWNKLPNTIEKKHLPFSRKATSLSNVVTFVKLVGFLKKEQFDCIYTHTPIASMLVRLAHVLAKDKAEVVYEIHGLHVHAKGKRLTNLIFKSIECALAKYTDKIITINHDDFAFAKKNFSHAKLFYSPGIGVDVDYYKRSEADRTLIRAKYSIDNNDIVIITIADFIRRKRIDLCIATAKILLDQGCMFKWLIVGDGLLMSNTTAAIQKAELQKHIVLAGHQKDVRPFLSASDIFMLLSMQEGLPRSLLEAGAMGIPAVVSDIRGNRDLVDNGVNSFLVPTGEANAAASATIQLMTDANMRKEFGVKLQAKIMESFSLKSTLAIHEKIFFDEKIE